MKNIFLTCAALAVLGGEAVDSVDAMEQFGGQGGKPGEGLCFSNIGAIAERIARNAGTIGAQQAVLNHMSRLVDDEMSPFKVYAMQFDIAHELERTHKQIPLALFAYNSLLQGTPCAFTISSSRQTVMIVPQVDLEAISRLNNYQRRALFKLCSYARDYCVEQGSSSDAQPPYMLLLNSLYLTFKPDPQLLLGVDKLTCRDCCAVLARGFRDSGDKKKCNKFNNQAIKLGSITAMADRVFWNTCEGNDACGK